MAQFASQAVSAAQSAVDAARQNLERAAQAAIDAAQAQVDAAQQAAQAAAQAVSDAQSRVDAAQTALERAQDAVRQGYEDQAAALRDTVSRLQSFVKGIQQFKDSLALDDSLSPFSPAQQLAEPFGSFREMIERESRLSVYCKGLGCGHGADLDLQALECFPIRWNHLIDQNSLKTRNPDPVLFLCKQDGV